MVALNLTLSIITSSVNELNTPITRQRLTECVKKVRPNYMGPTRNIL